MTDLPRTKTTDGVPTYLGRGDPAGRFADYRPAWVDKMADDVTLEGSLLDGAVQGADAVRAVIGGARQLYDRQDFNFVGPCGDNSVIEDYTAEVRGQPVGAIHLITFNADGEAQHVIVNYRPLSSLMLFSRLLREKFAGTPYAEHYLAGAVERH
jgi:hypothetical protein